MTLTYTRDLHDDDSFIVWFNGRVIGRYRRLRVRQFRVASQRGSTNEVFTHRRDAVAALVRMWKGKAVQP